MISPSVIAFMKVFNKMLIEYITPPSEHRKLNAVFFSSIHSGKNIILMPYHWINITLDILECDGLIKAVITHFNNSIRNLTTIRPLNDHTFTSLTNTRNKILEILKSQLFIDELAIELLFPAQD